MIDLTYFWTIVFLLMIGTFLIRGTLIFASSRVKIPDRVRELFSYIPAAILPAFVVPAIFFHQGHVQVLHGKERMFILVLASAVCLWTRSTLLTICFGLFGLYILTQVL
jgi:branched-subunit amino acid transport protein